MQIVRRLVDELLCLNGGLLEIATRQDILVQIPTKLPIGMDGLGREIRDMGLKLGL
jgi:hypothetical protein